jgi:hypothetical protein
MKKTIQRVRRKNIHQEDKTQEVAQGSLARKPGVEQAKGPGSDWSGLQRLGNHTLLRLAERGHLEGEIPIRQMNPDGLRQAVLAQVAQKTGTTSAIQKEDGEAEEPVPAAAGDTSTGTVTVLEPQVVPYDVSGTTLEEVGAQLDPEEWGRCHWNVTYNVQTTGGRVTRVNITMRLTIRMPRWTQGYSEASAAARAEWQRMLTALQAHEDHHAAMARERAPRFKENILGQPAGEAGTRYQETLDDLQTDQDTYDTETSHGETEGVTLDTSIE